MEEEEEGEGEGEEVVDMVVLPGVYHQPSQDRSSGFPVSQSS